MFSTRLAVSLLLVLLIDRGAISAELFEGVFTQTPNGFSREPVIGPSRLTIANGRFVLNYRDQELAGSVRGSKDVVILDCDDPSFATNIATTFCATRYENKVVLVALDSVTAFCNSLNSRNRLGPTGTGAVVLSRPATEDEQLIEELGNPLIRPLLRKQKIACQILDIKSDLTDAKIPGSRFEEIQGFQGTCSLTASDGAFPGMALHFSKASGSLYGIAWIMSVSKDGSAILVEQLEKGAPRPAIGTELTLHVP
jgi:hypothetical protein